MVYEYPKDVRAFVGQRQIANCFSENYDYLMGGNGFAKIPGHKSEGPKLPKKPEVTPHVEPTSEEAANKKAEADLAAARANYTNNDMEKNPSAFKKGTPVQEQIVHIDPNKVIKKVNPGGNTFDEPTVQKYQQKIRQGEEIPAVRIEYGKTGGIEGYDGRHRAEAARREGVPLKVWTRREVEPGEAPPTEIGPSDENPHELNGDENDIPEAAAMKKGISAASAPKTIAPDDESTIKDWRDESYGFSSPEQAARTRRAFPNLEGKMPKQEKLPDAGEYPAVRTEDGSIFVDKSGDPSTHITFIREKGIPPEKVKDGGWIQDGDYEPTNRSEASQYGDQARAILRVKTARAAAMKKGISGLDKPGNK